MPSTDGAAVISVEEFISVTEAARRLNLSRWTVYELVRRGEITAAKYGNKWQVRPRSVTAYAKRLMGESA